MFWSSSIKRQHCLSCCCGKTWCSGHKHFRKLLAAQVLCHNWHRLITSQESANAFLGAAFRPSLNSLAIANQFAPFKNAFWASVTAHQAVRRSLLQTKTNSFFYRTVLSQKSAEMDAVSGPPSWQVLADRSPSSLLPLRSCPFNKLIYAQHTRSEKRKRCSCRVIGHCEAESMLWPGDEHLGDDASRMAIAPVRTSDNCPLSAMAMCSTFEWQLGTRQILHFYR